MSFPNPTHVRIGMRGNLNGLDFKVVARLTLGETEDGETYYWNEYCLETNEGATATLVHEESDENDGRWRLFTLFEPTHPISVRAAEKKEVGDDVNLTGEAMRITFRGESRVYAIEGTAPEGVTVDDVACYFNAEGKGVMQVVSWTGDELECYYGMDMTQRAVSEAFGIAENQLIAVAHTKHAFESGSETTNASSHFIRIVILIVGAIFALGAVVGVAKSMASKTRETKPLKKIVAQQPPLLLGAQCDLNGKTYKITAYNVVEIATMHALWERFEYELTNHEGHTVLLICGEYPGDTMWSWMEPYAPSSALTGVQAAILKVGDSPKLDNNAWQITQLLRATIIRREDFAASHLPSQATRYGFRAIYKAEQLLTLWDERESTLYRGRSVRGDELRSQFH